MFSCLFLSRKKYYQVQPDIFAFVDTLLYIICTYNSASRCTTIFRDEDVCYPFNFEYLNDCEGPELFNRLQNVIQTAESQPKAGSKSLIQQGKDYIKCFKLLQSMLVITMYIFDHRAYLTTFFPDSEKAEEVKVEESTEAESNQSKKKKKKKNKAEKAEIDPFEEHTKNAEEKV